MGRRTVLILTGEPSGDRAGGALARELILQDPDLTVRAVGGNELRAAGAEIVEDIQRLGAMGFLEVLRQVPRLRALEARLDDLLRNDPPDVVVPIDYPGFNLRVARRAKEAGVPVVYYIGPQVWAWGAGRVPKIANAVDRMLVVFPFEVDIYRNAGLRVDFVGHPLLDGLEDAPGRDDARRRLELPRDAPVLGLLPGSRVQEVRRILPVMEAAAAHAREGRPELRVVASRAAGVAREEYPPDLRLHDGPASEIIRASDFLLVTSGTATLETALLGAPLAVIYRTSPLTFWIGKRLVKIPRISLVNIVAGEDLVAEFIQEEARPDRIGEHVREMLDDPDRRSRLSASLRELREQLGRPGVAGRAAELVREEMSG